MTSPTPLAALIDHTWLPQQTELPDNPEATLQQLCDTARKYQFAAVCVRPEHITHCVQQLQGSGIAVASVIGFPPVKSSLKEEQTNPTIGREHTGDKVAQIQHAVAAGATELDVVWDVAAFCQGANVNETHGTVAELEAYKQAAGVVPIKLIIETDLVPAAFWGEAARLCAQTGMGMVKTSTGYVEGGQGATVAAIETLKEALGVAYPRVGIKASGGIRTHQQARALVEAGATRLGTSNGRALL